MLLKSVLTANLARDIVRASGWRPGAGSGGGGGGGTNLGGLLPPGGNPGDVLWYTFDFGSVPTPVSGWHPRWEQPNYLREIEDGLRPDLAKPWLGDNKAVPVYTFAARNPDYTETGDDTIDGTTTAANDGMTRNELLVWEDIPTGFWHYPFNVPWFVTKRELTARDGQYLGRQIKLRGHAIEGGDADLKFCASTSGTGSWATLVSADLSGGGAFNSGWMPFNEAAAADVFLGLFVDVRSSISTLHMGPIEVLMRWSPRGTLNPEEFLP